MTRFGWLSKFSALRGIAHLEEQVGEHGVIRIGRSNLDIRLAEI